MKTQPCRVSFIVLHMIPASDWISLSYREKMKYHYIVTVAGKKFPIKPLDPVSGVVEIAFSGKNEYARDHHALFSLLVDLYSMHQDAKIVYADDLYHSGNKDLVLSAMSWLVQRLPGWLQRRLPRYNNIVTLHSLLSLTH